MTARDSGWRRCTGRPCDTRQLVVDKRGMICTHQFANEQSQSNADRSYSGRSMLLGGKHEDDKDQFRRQKCLNKKTTNDRGVVSQTSRSSDAIARQETNDKSGGSNATKKLGDNDQAQTEQTETTSDEHGNGNGRVEHAALNSEECPEGRGQSQDPSWGLDTPDVE